MTARVFDQCGLGVAYVGDSGIVHHANTTFAAMLGLEIVEGCVLPVEVALPPDVTGAIAGTHVWRGELSVANGDASRIFLEVFPVVMTPESQGVGVVLITRRCDDAACVDSPERRGQSMRRFAGGLSHEFNNVLASIQGFAEIAVSLEPDTSTMLGRTLHNILRGCDQARECVGRARIMGGRVDSQSESHDLAALVISWCKEREPQLPPAVHLELDVRSGVPPVSVDCALLELAFDEIWANSLWAMAGKGILSVAVQPGGSVRWPVLLEILDTGAGMASDVQDQCCEPYYTTRDAAGAKGRGLAIVQGIVWAHEGRLAVESVQGRGTVVRIWLPGSVS